MDDLPSRLHNNPPDPIAELFEQLGATHQPLADRLVEIRDAFHRTPDDIADDDTANRFADFIKACTAFIKNAEAARVAAKEPHLAAGRAVDAFFKRLLDPVDTIKRSLSVALTLYQQQKPAEQSVTRTDLGARASLRTRWVFEVEDAEQVPRLYLSVNEGAIRAAIKAATTPDGRCDLKIPGVRVYASTISVVS